MKGDSRPPTPILKNEKLDFFYSILTLWESGKEPKIVKNSNSKEIRRFKKRRDKKGHMILTFSDFNRKEPLHLSEIRFRNVKDNQGMSILYHIRNAFAHNRIFLEKNKRILRIENEYNGQKNLQAIIAFDVLAIIAFDVLKELIETFLGKHNLTDQEKKTKTKKTTK